MNASSAFMTSYGSIFFSIQAISNSRANSKMYERLIPLRNSALPGDNDVVFRYEEIITLPSATNPSGSSRSAQLFSP
jgi:hypothetical protein